ncbi:hypothetical protein [Roseobacter sp. S98]|uniref:hypothetical protein n=1 Tax=Roseobacter algicola (ex Choi et al. 2025) (nom. illeg.) TaxID=3092138 RepID=UPI0035C7736F
MKRTAVFVSMLLSSAANADVRDGFVTWASFECSHYAELAGRETEQNNHFERGYETAKRLLSELRTGAISKAEALEEFPIGLSMRLSGPSNDFIIGRVYEAATTNADDRVIRRDDNGYPLPIDQWISNEELVMARANGLYLSSNCSAL